MRRFLLLTLVLAACGGGGIASTDPTPSSSPPTDPTTVTTPAASPEPLPTGPSALRQGADAPGLPRPLVPPEDIIFGGPPPDGIPAIDNPKFVSVEEADEWLDDREPVVVVDEFGEPRAYPIQILIWHEIVNDTVGGVPLAVTYCPLCNSAITFRRVVRGVEVTFGTSGKLYASNLVMYDRATESLWTQLDGRAVAGVLTGERLTMVSSPLLAWSDFKATYPEGKVLSRETGYVRRYGTNPYYGYDDQGTRPFLFRGDFDPRAVPKQRVVAIALEGEAAAWTLQAVTDDQAGAAVTPGMVGGRQVVIFWKAGQSSALEGNSTSGGRDVGSVGVFDPIVEGRALTFRVEGDRIIDRETGSAWDVTGRAVAGPLAGTQLTRIPHFDTFWFAWAAFYPDSKLIED